MTQDDGGYDLKSTREPAIVEPGGATPKPGEPGWVPPVPVIEGLVSDEERAAAEDVAQNKGMAILAYICFLIPLLAAPKSSFARFHANQGLIVFLLWCVAVFGNLFLWVFDYLNNRFLGSITVLHFFLGCIVAVVQVGLFLAAIALTVFGIIKAANGEKEPVPVLGQLTLIK